LISFVIQIVERALIKALSERPSSKTENAKARDSSMMEID